MNIRRVFAVVSLFFLLISSSWATELNFKVSKMKCKSCQSKIQKGLKSIPGIQETAFDTKTQTLKIKCEESVDQSVVLKKLEEIGYPAQAI